MPILGITINDVKRVFVKDDALFRNSPENPSTSLSQPAKWLTSLFSGTSSAGVTVNQETTLGITAVYRAVKIIGEGIAGLQGDVYREGKDGNRKKLPNHRVAAQLREPSLLYTGFTFKETMSAFAALRGNGISKINTDGTFRIIDPSTVETRFNGSTLVYVYQDEQGKTRTLDSSEVLHIPSLVMDTETALGKSPLTVHRETIGVSMAQTRYAAKFFKNGAHIDGFLSTDQKLSPEGIARMAQSWRARYTGIDNAGSTPVLEEGMKYVPLSLNPQDAMFVESSQLSVQEIARIFGVPLHMLASLERATFSNIEHQSREFVTYTLRPWVKKWEEEINRKLFTEQEKRLGYYFKFNLESLLRGDSESRARLIDTYMKWGIANRDEIRRLEGWNDSEDTTGKQHFVPVNMIPAEMAGQQQEEATPEEPPQNEIDDEQQ
jgi:HK97 family phage portal protein